MVHDRFGPDGILPLVRDSSAQTVAGELGVPDVGVNDLFGSARPAYKQWIAKAAGQPERRNDAELRGRVPQCSGLVIPRG